jgi:hypothetical protein
MRRMHDLAFQQTYSNFAGSSFHHDVIRIVAAVLRPDRTSS